MHKIRLNRFDDVALIHLSIKNQSQKKLGAAWTLRGTLLVCKPRLSFQRNVREVFVCEECHLCGMSLTFLTICEECH